MEFITTIIIIVKLMELNFCRTMLLHQINFIEKLLIFQVQKVISLTLLEPLFVVLFWFFLASMCVKRCLFCSVVNKVVLKERAFLNVQSLIIHLRDGLILPCCCKKGSFHGNE